MWWRRPAEVQTEHQNGEENGFKWLKVEWLLCHTAGLSISKTADLLGFSRITISRVYREWSEKEKISSEWQLCGPECLVDVRGQRRMGRLVRDDRKATVTQITTRTKVCRIPSLNKQHVWTLKQMGYSSRRPHQVPLLSAKNRKRRLQFSWWWWCNGVIFGTLWVTYGAFPLHGTARYGTVHFWGVFHWVLYLVPDTFLVLLRSRFQASRTVTKTWHVNSADHWLAGENHHYCVTELATRDPPLQPDPLDLNQHSQRRIRRNFCLNEFVIFLCTEPIYCSINVSCQIAIFPCLKCTSLSWPHKEAL